MKTADPLADVKAAASAGDWRKAVRIAARLNGLGDYREAITRAAAAIGSPDFYREIGKDPEQLIREGIAALKARFGI